MAARHVKIVNRVRGWCAIEIPRAGCTGLKHLAWMDAHGGEAFDREGMGADLHTYLGYTAAESGGLVVEWEHDTSGLFHFATWRPPAERSRSAWLAFAHGCFPQNEFFQPIHGCTWDAWVDFVTEQLHAHGGQADVHLRRQCDFYAEADVDAIVPLRRLDDFLRRRFGHEPHGRVNSSRAKLDRSRMHFSPWAGEQLVKVYARDSLLPLSDKFMDDLCDSE